MGTSTFFLGKIKSEHDIQSLEKYLISVTGIERVLMDTDDYEIKVEYDEKTIELKQVAEMINQQGYSIQ